ncbi:MAG: DUF1345 domain-containing protein [Novosphingobium sp.]
MSAGGAWQLGRRLAPPRFLLFLGLLVAGFLAHRAAFTADGWESAALAFDLAATVFLVSLIPFLKQSGGEMIRRHADANDANRMLVLIVTLLVTIVVMAAIAGELPKARGGDLFAILKLVGSLLLVWLFTNCVHALHYAHDFYTRAPDGKDCGGIDFPGTPEPAYSDFLYFALTLGMTFQTSDTDITAGRVRNVALFHSFTAFLFNIGVIAFTINALGGK